MNAPAERIAICGGYDVSSLAPLVELFLFGVGLSCDVYEAPYGVFRQEILDPALNSIHSSPAL